MAGDWIKLQNVTPDKPEIVALAEILKIDQDAAFGKCVRIWIWADQQTISGHDLSVTTSFLDRLTNCPGFSSALVEVGWLKARNGRLSIPNFDRHNGQTAKNRALTKDRMQRQRDDQSVTESSPEKRREEKKKRAKDVLAHVDPGNLPPAKKDPENIEATKSLIRRFTPPTPEEVSAYSVSAGLGINAARFIDHYESNGWKVGKNQMKDWQAAARNWARNDRGRGNQDSSASSLQPDFIFSTGGPS